MGRGGYDRAQPYTSAVSGTTRTRSTTRGRTTTRGGTTTGGTDSSMSGAESGISGYGTDPSGGCETVMGGHGRRGRGAIAESASNKSKVNVLVTILAVIFTQFLFCVIAATVILLHHARMVDWFPAILEFTGEGYLREVKEGETDMDLSNLE